jgi:hypothetical protein
VEELRALAQHQFAVHQSSIFGRAAQEIINTLLRKQTVEPVFGIIKQAMKFRQFLVRGVKHVGHEWNLVALAWNIKRMNVLKMA